MAPECPNKKTCAMFPLFRLAGALKTWQIRYCDAEYTTCERYKRASNGRSVPPTLMPNGATLRLPGLEDK